MCAGWHRPSLVRYLSGVSNMSWGLGARVWLPDRLIWHCGQAIVIWQPERCNLGGSYSLIWLCRTISGQWMLFPLSDGEPQIWRHGRCGQVIRLSWTRGPGLFAPISMLFPSHVDLKSSNMLWWYYTETLEPLFIGGNTIMHKNYKKRDNGRDVGLWSMCCCWLLLVTLPLFSSFPSPFLPSFLSHSLCPFS